MEAEEFYNRLEKRKYFVQLTNTGVGSHFENIFEFAEQYAEERVNSAFRELTKKVEGLKEEEIYGASSEYLEGREGGLEHVLDEILDIQGANEIYNNKDNEDY